MRDAVGRRRSRADSRGRGGGERVAAGAVQLLPELLNLLVLAAESKALSRQ